MSDTNILNENKIEKSEYVVCVYDAEYGFDCRCELPSLEEARRYARYEEDQGYGKSISIWLVKHPQKMAVVGNVVGRSTDIYSYSYDIDDYYIYNNESPKDVISLLKDYYNLDEDGKNLPDDMACCDYDVTKIYSINVELKIPSVFEYFMSKNHTGDSENNFTFIENFC